MDDWKDEKKVSRRLYASVLHSAYENVKASRSEQCGAIESCLAELSLTLCGLQTEVVTMVAVVDLDFAGSGNGKSLGRSLMCFDFSHFS